MQKSYCGAVGDLFITLIRSVEDGKGEGAGEVLLPSCEVESGHAHSCVLEEKVAGLVCV